MKKSLLCCFTLAAGISSAFAAEPILFSGISFNQISANGRYGVSSVYGTVTVYDFTTGTSQVFGPEDEESYEEYSLGLGNGMTADGSIILGSSSSQSKAEYLRNGVWYSLDVPDEDLSNLSNGITPDGSRICGSVGMSPMTMDDVIMQVPAYWDMNSDGAGYGEYHILPYPTKDFFGDVPQYVTAIYISKDGKTIVGQMQFNSGMMAVPVVYTQAPDGEWSYSLPTKDLFNPNNIPAVEYPGEAPENPDPTQFMTEENKAAYQEEYDNWNWPDPNDYMNDEQKAEYAEALEKYKEEYEAWREKYLEFQDYQLSVIDSSPNFVFNNVLLSTDDKYIVSTLCKEEENEDPWAWNPYITTYKPVTVNIATGELKTVDTDESILASGVADDGVILAHNDLGSVPMTGYLIKDYEAQPIEEYISNLNPAYGEWIKKNMTHEVVVDYDEEWNEIYEEITFTGIPVTTPDLSLISIWNNCPWDWTISAESVVFDMSAFSGISTVGAGKKDLSIVNGDLVVPEGFDTVEIYNISGVCVKHADGAEKTVKLNMDKGAYIAKGTRTDGSVSVIKFAK